MADFCRQCSIETFGEDFGDLKGLSTPEHTAQGLYAVVLCEDCGPIQVDHEGNCISPDCWKKGHKHGSQEAPAIPASQS